MRSNFYVTRGSALNNKESTAAEISSSAAPHNKGSCHFLPLPKAILLATSSFQESDGRTSAAKWSEKRVMDEVTKSRSPSFFILQTIKLRV